MQSHMGPAEIDVFTSYLEYWEVSELWISMTQQNNWDIEYWTRFRINWYFSQFYQKGLNDLTSPEFDLAIFNKSVREGFKKNCKLSDIVQIGPPPPTP